jgi:coenzyme PQQ precursor peptide PqqA
MRRSLDNGVAPNGSTIRPTGCRTQRKEVAMQWSKPSFQDIRFGFEITMYVATR